MKIDGKLIDTENTNEQVGIVLVDVQENLLPVIKKKEALIESLVILIQSIKLFELPLMITEQVPDKLGTTSRILLPHIKNIKRITKNTFSIFGSEDFCNILKDQNFRHLILSGIETPICIYLSAIDALKAGYEVTILSDCVGARRSEDEKVVFQKLEKAGCHIIPLESFLYGYLGSVDNLQFRSIGKLVKNRIFNV